MNKKVKKKIKQDFFRSNMKSIKKNEVLTHINAFYRMEINL